MLGAFGEATVRQTIKFRDQKPPKTRRFTCSGSIARGPPDVNAGVKMHRRAGVKMHQRRTPEGPRGGLLAFRGEGRPKGR